MIPKMLTTKMKEARVNISKALLSNKNPADVHSRLVTCDETWIHYYDSQSKQETIEWKHVESPRTKKFKASESSKMIMATIFWDSQGVIHIDYLLSGRTMTGNYYVRPLASLVSIHQDKEKRKTPSWCRPPTGQWSGPHQQGCNGCCEGVWI